MGMPCQVEEQPAEADAGRVAGGKEETDELVAEKLAVGSLFDEFGNYGKGDGFRHHGNAGVNASSSPSPSSILAVALAFACSLNARSTYLSTKLCTCAMACLHSAAWIARPYRKDTPARVILRSTPVMALSKDVRNCSASRFAHLGSSLLADSLKRNSLDESKKCILTSASPVRIVLYRLEDERDSCPGR